MRIVVKPSRPLRVRVNDATGAPVPGAAVEAIEPLVFHADARTGPDGSALLRIPADARVPWVIGLKPGVGFDYFENVRTRPTSPDRPFDYPPLPAEVSLSLDGAQTMRIKVLDSKDRPVAGVVLSPNNLLKSGKAAAARIVSGTTVSVTTDDAGLAVFEWLPRGNHWPGFDVRSATYFCPNPPRGRSPVPEPAELVVRVLRNTQLGGRLRFVDGRPAAGVRVRAEGHGPDLASHPRTTLSGDDGSYTLDVPPDHSYIVGVFDPTWAAPSHAGIVLREGQVHGGLDFTLAPGTLVRGVVTEAADRKPGVNLPVRLTEEGKLLPKELRGGTSREELSRGVFTDATGCYQFRVGPGRYELAVQVYGSEPMTLEVKAEPEIVRDIALKGPANSGFLNGVVREKTATGERALAGAMIEVLSVALELRTGITKSDSEGRFRVARGPGELKLYVNGGKHAGFIAIPSEADNVSLVVPLASEIRGRVVDTAGKGLAGRTVFLRLESGPDYTTSGHLRRGLFTDEQGRFR